MKKSFMSLIAVLFLLYAVPVSAQEFPVQGATIVDESTVLGAGNEPLWIAPGDATNDGNLDFVITGHKDFSSGKLAVVQKTGGTWDTGTLVITSPSGYNGISEPCIDEIKSDGDQWIVYRDHGQGNSPGELRAVKLDGTTVELQDHLLHVGWPAYVVPCVGDLENDGIDVYAHAEESGNGKIYKITWNSSTQTFDDEVIYYTSGMPSAHCQAARPLVDDFKGDGSETMLHMNNGLTSLNLLEYDGTEYVSTSLLTATSFNYCGRAVGNFDNLPGVDIMLADADENIYLISGGTFSYSIVVTSAENICAMACADLNNDGTDEVYAADDQGGLYQYSMTAGWNQIESNSGIMWWEGCMFAEDDQEKVAFVGEENGNVTIRTLYTEPEFEVSWTKIVDQSTVFGETANPLWLAVGDASNDGIVDLIVTMHKDWSRGKLAMYQGSGTDFDNGTLVITSSSGYNGIGEPCIGDLKGDGTLWVAYRDHGQGNDPGDIRIVRLDGTTMAEIHSPLHVGWPAYVVPCMGDLEGDGLDVYAHAEEGGKGNIYKITWNETTQAFEATIDPIFSTNGMPSGHGQAVRPIIADFVGDGSESMLHIQNTLTTLSLLTYDGTDYTSTELLTAGSFNYRGRAVGNIDNQPGVDIMVADNDKNLYLISGGTFTVTELPSTTVDIHAMTCADLNGNGTDEVYLAGGDGDLYQYTMATGVTYLGSYPGVQWWDGDRAPWTAENADHAAFVGVENGYVTTVTLYTDDFSLLADDHFIPYNVNSTVELSMDAGEEFSYRQYFMLGSVTGTEPGITLPGGKVLPVNWDIFTDIIFSLYNSPLFVDFYGQLDVNGQDKAIFNCIPLPAYGFSFHFAYAVIKPYDFVSNPVEVVVTP